MALINGIIEQQNFELVRDKIGEILKIELQNQFSLNPTLKVLDSKVFVERFIKFDKSELPAINVFFNSGNYSNQTALKQDGTYQYNIDMFTSAKSTDLKRGDSLSLVNLQRLAGVVRSILQSSFYIRLGFAAPSISHRSVKSIQISEPQQNMDGSNMMYGRLILEVIFEETAINFVPINLACNDTTIKLFETEKGYEWQVCN